MHLDIVFDLNQIQAIAINKLPAHVRQRNQCLIEDLIQGPLCRPS